jgi:2Fe-2S ferredoxin
MATITFVTPDGTQTAVEAEFGHLMEIATSNGIEGIEGACGGVCACCTCHVKIHSDWLEKVGKADDTEQDMLDDEDATDERSRLGCQVEITEDLDGLVVEVVPL